MSTNTEIVKKCVGHIWNDRDLDAASALIHDEIEYIAPRIHVNGKGDYVELISQYMGMFTNTECKFLKTLESGDEVASYMEFTGDHTAPYGDIPASNNRVTFRLMAIVKVKDGKMYRENEVFDEYGFLLGMGAEVVQKAAL
jgi:predicted ester cyclase